MFTFNFSNNIKIDIKLNKAKLKSMMINFIHVENLIFIFVSENSENKPHIFCVVSGKILLPL